MQDLTPGAIVQELDKYIVGQQAAKRAMAIALRNRIRRRLLPPEVREDIIPKNILMIGPTGVGKTEIARRVAALIDAPFIKVEATKFTEVGYVGRDVESIIRDLVESAIMRIHDEKLKEVESKAESLVTEKIVNYLLQQSAPPSKRRAAQQKTSGALSLAMEESSPDGSPSQAPRPGARAKGRQHQDRQHLINLVNSHQLEDQIIEIEVDNSAAAMGSVLEFPPGMSSEEITESFQEFFDNYKGYANKRRCRRVPVKEARRILTREEALKMVDLDDVVDKALNTVEENGVVFIDELDKIVGPKVEIGADVSGEGVQRDLLPILEGCTVMTRYGPVKTNHILFIAAGAFHRCKPADLIPEIQGRFPLRVGLSSLTREDLKRILVEPKNALTKQYQALLATEEVELDFTKDGLEEMARVSALANEQMENIGARRLHTIMERVLEDLSYSASERRGEKVVVDTTYVSSHLGDLLRDEDLSRYIL